jgi:hypothetical protein
MNPFEIHIECNLTSRSVTYAFIRTQPNLSSEIIYNFRFTDVTDLMNVIQNCDETYEIEFSERRALIALHDINFNALLANENSILKNFVTYEVECDMNHV